MVNSGQHYFFLVAGSVAVHGINEREAAAVGLVVVDCAVHSIEVVLALCVSACHGCRQSLLLGLDPGDVCFTLQHLVNGNGPKVVTYQGNAARVR